jgi:hypothetical protein
MCEFALNTIENIVAFGTVLEGEGMNNAIHGLPMPEGCVRVAMVGELKGDAPLPFPVLDAQMLLVRDAIGSHLAWPEKWVIRKQPTKGRKKSDVVKNLFDKNDLPKEVPKCCKLLYKHAKVTMVETRMSLTKKMDNQVFGLPITLIVLRENVIDLLEMKWLGAGVIAAYMA